MEINLRAPVEVLITLPLKEEVLQPVRDLSPHINLTVIPARRPEDIPAEVWAKTEVLYTDRVLPAPEQVPALRWLQFHFAGIDFAVDSPLLQKEDLKVTNLSGAAAAQTAEFALTMMLALAHRLPALMQAQSRAEWAHDRWERFRPVELRFSTVGIVGYGSIGRELARLLQPLGVKVLACKRDVRHPQDEEYIPEGMGDPQGIYFTRLYPYQALRTMFRECDFAVVTVPLTPQTRGMIGADELAALKPGAFLVVVGRGGVVDETALLEALQEKRLGGVALDVFAEEPLAPTSPLWKAPNLIISPHIAGLSVHYDERAMALFATNLRRYIQGERLYNLYEPERGY
ncbi:D-2-hydroxyacid dehydrogenase [Anaerolinea thermophila]|uniref:Oxidoreductase n=1 Tax=Anaerolinea thermophila (strain DSM 14523 / JCM 11388 / NBRC 100420 / UNI-1) TaxID=926569 RepID=E8N2B5_ANATU|nr:D-2-hydroxyacid dehydrogenase [Anaerolinea thermophila]BAJ62721.1 oxidoreductase [Anaerolinea thermophila UNI-1]